LATLRDAVQALGRPRQTHDIDLLVMPDDAPTVLEELARAGFETERRDPSWLFKGFKRLVLVDVIFRSQGNVYLDEEMLQRGVRCDFGGFEALVMAPEDLIVIKSLVAAENLPQHWFDALGLVSQGGLDWDYLVRRASAHGVRRVLSLLLYAESLDVSVPPAPVCQLFRAVHRCEEPAG
jgi:hypothetical protein